MARRFCWTLLEGISGRMWGEERASWEDVWDNTRKPVQKTHGLISTRRWEHSSSCANPERWLGIAWKTTNALGRDGASSQAHNLLVVGVDNCISVSGNHLASFSLPV